MIFCRTTGSCVGTNADDIMLGNNASNKMIGLNGSDTMFGLRGDVQYKWR